MRFAFFLLTILLLTGVASATDGLCRLDYNDRLNRTIAGWKDSPTNIVCFKRRMRSY